MLGDDLIVALVKEICEGEDKSVVMETEDYKDMQEELGSMLHWIKG